MTTQAQSRENLWKWDVDGGAVLGGGGGGGGAGGVVPREHEFHDATLCPRHVAHNVRENNLLKTDCDTTRRTDGPGSRGGKISEGPLVQENNQRRIPGFRSVTKQKGLLLVNVQKSPIQNWRVSNLALFLFVRPDLEVFSRDICCFATCSAPPPLFVRSLLRLRYVLS